MAALGKRLLRTLCRRPALIIERMEVDLVLSRLCGKRFLRMIDVGAHHGEFLDILEHHNDDHIYDVICVEPLRESVEILSDKHWSYRRVNYRICDVAISEKSGTREFYLGTASSLFTCTDEWLTAFHKEFRNARAIEVRCLTFDDLFSEYNLGRRDGFDFVKIDTEGHDRSVITSMIAAGIRPFSVMFEIGQNLHDTEMSINALKQHSFSEFYVFGRNGIPTTFIGDYRGYAHLKRLRARGRLNAGNVVAF